jgi:hypothetical protein
MTKQSLHMTVAGIWGIVLPLLSSSGLTALLFSSAACGNSGAKLVRIDQGGRCGYADLTGKVIIAPRYRSCGDFSQGLAAIRGEKGWGYTNLKGEEVVAPHFVHADAFSDGLAFVELNGQTLGVIDTTGKILFRGDYYEHGRFRDGLAPVRIPASFECADDSSGCCREILPDQRKQCPEGYLRPSDRGKDWGYIDKSGKLAIPLQFSEAGEFHEGTASVGRERFIDRQGHSANPGTIAAVCGIDLVGAKEASCGYEDKSGKLVSPPNATLQVQDGRTYIWNRGAYVFEEAKTPSGGRGLVRIKGKYGYVDTSSGALAIAAQYDDAQSFSEGLAAVGRGEKWGYVDLQGRLAIPFRFDSVMAFEDGSAMVSSGGKVFRIDKAGAELKARPVSLAEIFDRLQELQVVIDPSNVPIEPAPKEIQPLLSLYKDRLRELAMEKLNLGGAHDVEQDINRELVKAGIREAKRPVELRPYGLVNCLDVVQPTEQPTLRAVTFHLNLGGSQTFDGDSLSLFHHGHAGWELVWRKDGEDDKFETPEFTRNGPGEPFLMLVVSRGDVNIQGGYPVTAELVRFDASLHSQQLFQKYLGYAIGQQYALDPDGFRIELLCCQGDPEVHPPSVDPFHYQVQGDKVVRVAPFVFHADQFAEEWGNWTWEEAAPWSDPANLARLKEWHRKLRGAKDYVPGTFDSAQLCDANHRTWQVQLHDDDDSCDACGAGAGKEKAPRPRLFFVVEQKDRWTFVMKDVRETPLRGCRDAKEEKHLPTMFKTPMPSPLDEGK